MSRPQLVLLPAQGSPLARVWLPPGREPSGLVVAPRTSDNAETAFRRRAEELGLTPVLRPVGTFAIDVYVWLCWVKPGERPNGLDEVSAEDLVGHAVYGPMIRKIREAQARQ